MGGAQAQSRRTPDMVSDEVIWDLLRDEWELLLALGNGSRTLEQIRDLSGVDSLGLERRLDVLVECGLLEMDTQGYRLLPLVHRRRESMSTYLNELVLSRIDLKSSPIEITSRVGHGNAGGLAVLHGALDDEVFPQIVELATGEESETAERYLLVFAATTTSDVAALGGASVAGFLQVLRASALERTRDEENDASEARVWVAEMNVEPTVATQIARLLIGAVHDVPETSFAGAITAGMWSVLKRDFEEV